MNKIRLFVLLLGIMLSPASWAKPVSWVWMEVDLSEPKGQKKTGLAEVIQINNAVSIKFEGMLGKQNNSILCTVLKPSMECSDQFNKKYEGFVKKSSVDGLMIDLKSGSIYGQINTYMIFKQSSLLIISKLHDEKALLR